MSASVARGPRILALWSAPRSRSTAFSRMMAERGDFTTVHEPFSLLSDFGECAVGDLRVRTEQELIAALREESARNAVFFKDTTDFHYPHLLADQSFLRDATHTFIIRHPAQAIRSHLALNPNLTRDEIGFARLAEIFDATREATGEAPVVVDSDDLLAEPEQTVRAYCERVGIPFLPEALHWQSGMREEWRGTARWHESTSRTTGFTAPAPAPPEPVTEAESSLVAEYVEFHLPYYEHLRAERLLIGV